MEDIVRKLEAQGFIKSGIIRRIRNDPDGEFLNAKLMEAPAFLPNYGVRP